MTAEIIGPDGKVHYRRPVDHPDIDEALDTPGYGVRLHDMTFYTYVDWKRYQDAKKQLNCIK